MCRGAGEVRGGGIVAPGQLQGTKSESLQSCFTLTVDVSGPGFLFKFQLAGWLCDQQGAYFCLCEDFQRHNILPKP